VIKPPAAEKANRRLLDTILGVQDDEQGRTNKNRHQLAFAVVEPVQPNWRRTRAVTNRYPECCLSQSAVNRYPE